MRRLWLLGILCLLLLPTSAQDGLNLPTELYVLLNTGTVERYGLGTAGIQQVTPDDDFVLDFRVAPDGNWIAYRTQDGLYMQNMFREESRRPIDTDSAGVPPTRGRGETIAWAYDGSAIAYTTESGARVHLFDSEQFFDIPQPELLNLVWSPQGDYLALEARDNIWWIYRRTAEGMILALPLGDANGVTWLDASTILFAPLEGGLVTIDLAMNNQRTEIADSSNRYFKPYHLEDGTVRVFMGDDATNATLQQVIITNTDATVNEIGLNAIDTTNVRWSPRGSLMIAFQGGALALIDPLNGGGFTLPITTSAAYSWGPEYPPVGAGVQLPTDGYFIALDSNGIEQVWRLPADGSTATPITDFETPISEYAFAPNDSQLAVVSQQTLYLLTLASDEDPTELASVDSENMLYPAWSPDGQTIYYTNGGRIEQVNTETGDVTAFVQPIADTFRYVKALPARGISAVAVTIRYAGGDRSFGIYNAETGDRLVEYLISPAVLSDDAIVPEMTYFSYGDPYWLPTTELLFVGTVLNIDGIEPRPTLPEPLPALYQVDVNNLVATPQMLFPFFFGTITEYVATDTTMRRWLFKRRAVAENLILDMPRDEGAMQIVGNAGYMVNPTISPDGSVIVGQTSPGGALIVYNHQTNQRTLIDTFPQVSGFQWR